MGGPRQASWLPIEWNSEEDRTAEVETGALSQVGLKPQKVLALCSRSFSGYCVENKLRHGVLEVLSKQGVL